MRTTFEPQVEGGRTPMTYISPKNGSQFNLQRRKEETDQPEL